jgi:hypothetical protein
LEFQQAAVKIAAKKLDKRDGVLIGDVVGLGKTITAKIGASCKSSGISTLMKLPFPSFIKQEEVNVSAFRTTQSFSILPNRYCTDLPATSP